MLYEILEVFQSRIKQAWKCSVYILIASELPKKKSQGFSNIPNLKTLKKIIDFE